MGLIKCFAKLSAVTTGAGLSGYWYLFRDTKFVPLSQDDYLFNSPYYKKFNPLNNPTTHDLCIERVPLDKIDKNLLKNDGKDGKLAEAFCASVWGGLGYAFQRSYFAQRYQNPQTAHQLWETKELRLAPYKVGTQITDHFEVLEKTPTRIIVRCGDSPLNRDVRASDGLFEMSAVVKKDEGVAEFGLKSVFYSGTQKAEKGPMSPFMAFMHRQYDRILLETAIWRLLRG